MKKKYTAPSAEFLDVKMTEVVAIVGSNCPGTTWHFPTGSWIDCSEGAYLVSNDNNSMG